MKYNCGLDVNILYDIVLFFYIIPIFLILFFVFYFLFFYKIYWVKYKSVTFIKVAVLIKGMSYVLLTVWLSQLNFWIGIDVESRIHGKTTMAMQKLEEINIMLYIDSIINQPTFLPPTITLNTSTVLTDFNFKDISIPDTLFADKIFS